MCFSNVLSIKINLYIITGSDCFVWFIFVFRGVGSERKRFESGVLFVGIVGFSVLVLDRKAVILGFGVVG